MGLIRYLSNNHYSAKTEPPLQEKTSGISDPCLLSSSVVRHPMCLLPWRWRNCAMCWWPEPAGCEAAPCLLSRLWMPECGRLGPTGDDGKASPWVTGRRRGVQAQSGTKNTRECKRMRSGTAANQAMSLLGCSEFFSFLGGGF